MIKSNSPQSEASRLSKSATIYEAVNRLLLAVDELEAFKANLFGEPFAEGMKEMPQSSSLPELLMTLPSTLDSIKERMYDVKEQLKAALL